MATLNDKNIGDIVRIKENGVAVNFIIIHKGQGLSVYSSVTDGVWLLREEAYPERIIYSVGGSDPCEYSSSNIHEWLNNGYLSFIDQKIRAVIKDVVIPYTNQSGIVINASKGLSCRVFSLSGSEVGLYQYRNSNDGRSLSFFSEDTSKGGSTVTNGKRICYATVNGKNFAVSWITRNSIDEDPENTDCISYPPVEVSGNGRYSPSCIGVNDWAEWSYYVRPAFILPYDLAVNSDGTVTTNNSPAITSDKTGNLGTLTNGFTCNYSVNDTDAADALTVTLTLDGAQKSKFTAVRGTQYTCSITGSDWLRITNGSHTFKISVTDGKETVESTAAFSRSVNGAFIGLDTPMEADDVIRACSLLIEGSFPADAVCKYEVTNNALDDEPVWEDCTERSKSGLAYIFKNGSAENGFAFNFRVSVKRGASNAGGYITKVSGGFE